MSDISEELGRLADLRDRGVLTQDEFDQQEAALLHPAADAAPSVSAAATAPAPSPIPATVPAPAAKPRPPGYAPPSSGSNTAIFVIVGVVAILVIAIALWATGVFRPRGMTNGATTASTDFAGINSNLSAPITAPGTAATPLASSNPTPVPAPAAADDTWLMGQWENVATPGCAQWLRFGSDHSLGDNANGSGTWSLANDGAGGYTLSMNITGTGLRAGPIARDAAGGTITMGSGPGAVTWRKTTC